MDENRPLPKRIKAPLLGDPIVNELKNEDDKKNIVSISDQNETHTENFYMKLKPSTKKMLKQAALDENKKMYQIIDSLIIEKYK